MKVRTDFVTNSSSSSFILAFKDDKDYEEFKNRCEWLDYEEFGELIDNILKNHSQKQLREEAESQLHWYYSLDEVHRITEEKFPDFNDRVRHEFEYRDTEEFKTKIEEYLKTTEYAEQKERLDNAEIVCEAEIWDTDGGLLEWAIRNGFIKSEFWQWFICQQDIG